MTAPQFFICIRRSGIGPRAYPVVKLPDGTVTETTWNEYRASLRRDIPEHDEVGVNNAA